MGCLTACSRGEVHQVHPMQQLPSGKRLHFAIENGHRNSGFTH